jgi:hypothetical protein
MGRTTQFQMRKSTEAGPQGPGFVFFPGVGDHGMADIASAREPGRPRCRFPHGENLRTTVEREDGGIGGGESDHLIVPKKAGNAAGGKEVTW